MINSNEDNEATLLYNYYYVLNKAIRDINYEIKILISDRDFYIKQKLLIKIIIIRYLTEIKNIKKGFENWVNNSKKITLNIQKRKIARWITDRYKISSARNNWKKITNLLRNEMFLDKKNIILSLITINRTRLNILNRCFEIYKKNCLYYLENKFINWYSISRKLYKREDYLLEAMDNIEQRQLINDITIMGDINYKSLSINFISFLKKYVKKTLKEVLKQFYINFRIKIETSNEKNNLQMLISREEIKELKNILSKKAIELSAREKLMVVEIKSINQDISYSMICKNTSIFSEMINSLYNIYPKYRDVECFFICNGKKINEYQTLEKNGIKSGDNIILNIYD